ncbi:MAG: ABC transporter substrate-binding protein, partial [Caldivirga sp.]
MYKPVPVKVKVKSIILSVVAILVAVAAILSVHVVNSASPPQIIIANPSTLLYSPNLPLWNPVASSGSFNKYWGQIVDVYESLAMYNDLNGQFYPVLAANWTYIPQNNTFIIHLRKGLYWFNGTATIPFTAWDVWANIILEVLTSGQYWPALNNTDIGVLLRQVRVVNNYTLELTNMSLWSPIMEIYILNQANAVETPYPVWKPILEKLLSMNSTERSTFIQNNLTRMLLPYWGISPWYLTYVSSSYIQTSLEPSNLLSEWYQVFPYASWNYYNPSIVVYYVGGSSQAIAALESGSANYASMALSPQQITALKSAGFFVYVAPGFSDFGISINPLVYPWNMTQVRQALAYVINRTEAVLAWAPLYEPQWNAVPTPPYTLYTYPKSVLSVVYNYTVNWTKAAQLLESIGMYKKGNQWYLPNGTPLTLNIVVPNYSQDWITILTVVANQLTEFGIPTHVIAIDGATFWGSYFWQGNWIAASMFVATPMTGYYGTWHFYMWPWWVIPQINMVPKWWTSPYGWWPFQWPNGTCTPVTLFNHEDIVCVNSTYGYFSPFNWTLYGTRWSGPGTPQYELLTKILFAWWEYYIPVLPVGASLSAVMEFKQGLADVNWVLNCLPFTTQQVLLNGGNVIDGLHGFSPILFGVFAPTGQVPPLAQAIANGSLWTKTPQFAAFIGLPNPDASIQSCVA